MSAIALPHQGLGNRTLYEELSIQDLHLSLGGHVNRESLSFAIENGVAPGTRTPFSPIGIEPIPHGAHLRGTTLCNQANTAYCYNFRECSLPILSGDISHDIGQQ